MKCLVVGVEHINYNDKKTGDPKAFIKLGCVSRSVKSFTGRAVQEVLIYDFVLPAVYSALMREFAPNKFVGLTDRFINVDYDNNGQICNFEVLFEDESKNAVVWGF